jgi:serine/threonine protein kinase
VRRPQSRYHPPVVSASGEFATVEDATLISGDSIMGNAVGLARLGPGKLLARYVVLSRLGVGSAGVLYTAHDPRSDRRVALRLLRPPSDREESSASEGTPTSRLLLEAKELAALRHPNLVTVHDVGVVEGVVYLAMDYLDGGTLRRWLDAGPHPWPEALAKMVAVAAGLVAIHEAGLVHGDLRPANILLDSEGEPHLVEFGLSRRDASKTAGATISSERRIDESTSVESLHAPLIRTGKWVGVPAYMAPEQYAGEEVDARSDQFSFCVMLYEALYGERPFEGRSVQALFLAVEEGRVKPPRRGAGVPRGLREIVVRGLAHDPAQRWPSMGELLEALGRDHGRTRRRLGAGVALAVALAASLGALLSDGPGPSSSQDLPSPLEAELTHASELLEAGQFERAREALAKLEQPIHREGPELLQARHALLSARALGRSDEAESEAKLLDALAEASAAGDEALGLEIAHELGVRIELRRIDALTRTGQIDEAREHLVRARRLLAQQQSPDPTLTAALERWQQSHP